MGSSEHIDTILIVDYSICESYYYYSAKERDAEDRNDIADFVISMIQEYDKNINIEDTTIDNYRKYIIGLFIEYKTS